MRSYVTKGRANPWDYAPYRQHPNRREWIHGKVRSDLDCEPLSGAVIAIGIIGNLTMWAGVAAYVFGGG